MGISRPIQRETTADQPFPEVGSPDKTCRDRTPILVCGNRGATHRSAGDETIQFVGRLGAAAVQIAVSTPAQLAAFRRINTPKPDAGSMYVQGITIDDTGLSDKICSRDRPGQEQEREYERSACDHWIPVLSADCAVKSLPIPRRFQRPQMSAAPGQSCAWSIRKTVQRISLATNAERVCAETILKQ